MYRYAVSVNASLIRLPEWRKALSESRFHRIELSCGQYLEPQETKELVELVRNADELAGVETASVHLPFCPFEKFPYPAGEKEREAVAEYLAEFIRLTAPLTAKNYTFHASIEPVRPEERGMLLGRSSHRWSAPRRRPAHRSMWSSCREPASAIASKSFWR